MEAHQPLGEQDMKRAGKSIKGFLAHMQYSMKLDGMATQEGRSGLRWFNNVDELAATAEGGEKAEARSIGRYNQTTESWFCLTLAQRTFSPKDTSGHLLRSQPFTLLYLSSPPLHLLISLSPLAYLDNTFGVTLCPTLCIGDFASSSAGG